ncbi:hypothetical protein B0H17DRAFT_1179237 [Mycena rosella]|uniref:Uncharacterized protein n=1 Tax=Mycena rosella TaxID=1033263 RepID=A0AAD7GFV2_MYCRO|nr:hypothetical protein B0H17DRAFT_1179237 [Mycena rosella]
MSTTRRTRSSRRCILRPTLSRFLTRSFVLNTPHHRARLRPTYDHVRLAHRVVPHRRPSSSSYELGPAHGYVSSEEWRREGWAWAFENLKDQGRGPRRLPPLASRDGRPRSPSGACGEGRIRRCVSASFTLTFSATEARDASTRPPRPCASARRASVYSACTVHGAGCGLSERATVCVYSAG